MGTYVENGHGRLDPIAQQRCLTGFPTLCSDERGRDHFVIRVEKESSEGGLDFHSSAEIRQRRRMLQGARRQKR